MIAREQLHRLVSGGLEQRETNIVSALVETVTRLVVAVPQVRGTRAPFRSSLMSFLYGSSEVLDRLVT